MAGLKKLRRRIFCLSFYFYFCTFHIFFQSQFRTGILIKFSLLTMDYRYQRSNVLLLFVVIVLCLLQDCCTLHHPRFSSTMALRATTNSVACLESLKEQLLTMRAAEVKRLLVDSGYSSSTTGIFEKRDLVDALLRVERDALTDPRIESVDLIQFGDSSAAAKLTVGVQLSKKGVDGSFNFVVDTGATVNLIRKEASQALKGVVTNTDQYTSTFGGVGRIASSISRVSDLYFTGSSGSDRRIMNAECAVMNDPNALPRNVDGLLGLNFIRSLMSTSDHVIEIGKL